MGAKCEWDGASFRIWDSRPEVTKQMAALIAKTPIIEVAMRITLEDGTVFDLDGQVIEQEEI